MPALPFVATRLSWNHIVIGTYVDPIVAVVCYIIIQHAVLISGLLQENPIARIAIKVIID